MADHRVVAGVQVDHRDSAARRRLEVRDAGVLDPGREDRVVQQSDPSLGDRGGEPFARHVLGHDRERLAAEVVEDEARLRLVHVVAEHLTDAVLGQLRSRVAALLRRLDVRRRGVDIGGGDLADVRSTGEQHVDARLAVRGHRARHEHEVRDPLGHATRNLGDREPGHRVADEHETVVARGIGVDEHGRGEVRDGQRRAARAAARGAGRHPAPASAADRRRGRRSAGARWSVPSTRRRARHRAPERPATPRSRRSSFVTVMALVGQPSTANTMRSSPAAIGSTTIATPSSSRSKTPGAQKMQFPEPMQASRSISMWMAMPAEPRAVRFRPRES